MYNQYLDNREFVQVEPEANASTQGQAPSAGHDRPAGSTPGGASSLLEDVTGGISKLLGGVFKNFSLENFDTGDILLILIILFLFLEGDNLEIVITLGLMLLLGLGDDETAQ